MIRIIDSDEMKAIFSRAFDLSLKSFPKPVIEDIVKKIDKIIKPVFCNDVLFVPLITIICSSESDFYLLDLIELLSKQNFDLKIFVLLKTEKISELDKFEYDLFNKNLSENVQLEKIIDKNDLKKLENHINSFNSNDMLPRLIINALIDCDCSENFAEIYSDIITLITLAKKNDYNTKILFYYNPVNNIDNLILSKKIFIQSDYTFFLGSPTLGSCFYPEKFFLGQQDIIKLPNLEDICKEEHKSKIFKIDIDTVKKLLPSRHQEGSKYDHGSACIVAGSKNMSGAAFLTAFSAMRSGIGIVHLYTESDARKLIATQLPEIITHDLFELKHKMKSDILTIGPGLGENCNELVYDLILNSDSPIILDADGINAFANKIDLLKSHKSLLLITPHLKEYSRLFPNDFIETLDPLKKIDLLKQRSIDLNATILLKGATTIITDPYGNCFINDNGNSALATAGSGDVLTGIITGIAAQILKSHNNKDLLTNAAIISAHLHCIAGNLASEKLSEYSVIARDIVNNIPISFKTLLIDT